MGLPLPETLTPSKLGKFVTCPLSFRFTYVDHLKEPSSVPQVRGTLVHRALQILYADNPPCERTAARARAALDTAWQALEATEEIVGLNFDETGRRTFVREAQKLLEHYFSLEDPAAVKPVGLELDLRARVNDMELRGIIDRLDFLSDERFVVVDYKTGRSPIPGRSRSSLAGVQFYALLCEEVLGQRPVEIRLLYLKDQVVIVETPTDQSMRGVRQRARAVWDAIDRACTTEDFRPNPTPLCKSCSFQAYCPAFGGDPGRARNTN